LPVQPTVQVMYRVYSTQHDARSPLRKQMSSLSSSFVERSAETIKLRNDDLMSYHAIAVSLREFVEALLVSHARLRASKRV